MKLLGSLARKSEKWLIWNEQSWSAPDKVEECELEKKCYLWVLSDMTRLWLHNIEMLQLRLKDYIKHSSC